jgi:hypothetical protein
MQSQVREIAFIKVNLFTSPEVADLNKALVIVPSDDQRQFRRLNSVIQPGLTEAEFRNLFTKCRYCDGIKIREANAFHHCPAEVPTDSEEDSADTDVLTDSEGDTDVPADLEEDIY